MATRKRAVAAGEADESVAALDESLIPPTDVEADEELEDPDYDRENDKVDPETQGHADMEPDPGEEDAE